MLFLIMARRRGRHERQEDDVLFPKCRQPAVWLRGAVDDGASGMRCPPAAAARRGFSLPWMMTRPRTWYGDRSSAAGQALPITWSSVRAARRARCTIAEKLTERLKQEFGHSFTGSRDKDQGDWVLIDASDVIVHVFRPEVREFYRPEDVDARRRRAGDSQGLMRHLCVVGRLREPGRNAALSTTI